LCWTSGCETTWIECGSDMERLPFIRVIPRPQAEGPLKP
jgi:hypothetical protein